VGRPSQATKKFWLSRKLKESDWLSCDEDRIKEGVEVTSISLNRNDNEYILIKEFVMARSLSYKAVSVLQAIAITAAIAVISGQIQLDFTSISEVLSNSSFRIHIPLLDKG
jgi:fibronectin type 3 domain-containing protein